MSIATQKTLKELRKQGYRAGVVERWLRYAGVYGKRQDLFGIIDIIAISPTETIGVQSCTTSFAAHYRELTEEKNQECYDWLQCPGRKLAIWAWRKVKKERGKDIKVWRPRIHEITLEELEI